jgi:nucleoside-triphosphatase THEP1
VKGSSIIYYRLIALWVICEAFLGGIIHGFRIPVSGLIVGSAAVICICLIGYYYPKRGAILKATLIVCIFKMMLSPQAPFPAYIAVLFQGLVGEVLFGMRHAAIVRRPPDHAGEASGVSNRQSATCLPVGTVANLKYYKLACFLLGILSLTESGLQRIIVLTIIYGMEGWKALDKFLSGLTGSTDNYSLWLGGGYLGLHVITGVLVGIWAGRIPSEVESRKWKIESKWEMKNGEPQVENGRGKRKKVFKASMLIIWFLLIGLYVQSYFGFGKPILPASVPLRLFIRSFIIILAWYLVFAPLLKWVLHKWLKKKQSSLAVEIEQVVGLLPEIKNMAISSWESVKNQKGFVRIWEFSKNMLFQTLRPIPNSQFPIPNSKFPIKKLSENVFILTGPIGSGKTTYLLNWSAGRDDVYGILTPIINGKRVFMDARTRETWDMEITDEQESERRGTNVLKVGRYTFSQAGFTRATRVIEGHIRAIRDKNLCNPCWIIIDEIGPLEFAGQGFAEILPALRAETANMIVVVREGLANQVQQLLKNPIAVTLPLTIQ